MSCDFVRNFDLNILIYLINYFAAYLETFDHLNAKIDWPLHADDTLFYIKRDKIYVFYSSG